MLEEQDAFLDQAQTNQQIVHNTAAGQESEENVGCDNPGNEIGQIRSGLDEFFQPDVFQFIEHDSQDDGRREGKQQCQQTGCQRVPHDHAEILGEEILEPLQANEFGVKQIVEISVLGGSVIGKGHIQASHRRIADHQHPDDAGNHQQKQVFLIPQPAHQRLFLFAVQSKVRHGISSFTETEAGSDKLPGSNIIQSCFSRLSLGRDETVRLYLLATGSSPHSARRAKYTSVM